jgi:adenine specific DNA methylase Mod
MTKEQKFYQTLQDVFIGAKIEGKGGGVNLMRIKSNYYNKIEQLLKKDIEKALEKYPSFRDELFDKLYSFFSRYFSRSGSIYFNYTPLYQNVYNKVYEEENIKYQLQDKSVKLEQVYSDDKDVILFWKTHMLYYVKSDRIFNNLLVEFDDYKFFFDISKLEYKKSNEKRSLIYEFKNIRKDEAIVFEVFYSEGGKITKIDEIKKALRKKDIKIKDGDLERAFKIFEKQSEVDFFINKNAKAFLQEQFKLWSYQYFWEGAKEWSADRVNELQILKDIAFKIIDFISQFEDELVKIWNKPKFVKNSNYVITLDRILSACHSEQSEESINLIEKILKHKNINEQIREWQELSIVDESFKVSDIFTTDLTGRHLSERYQHLPIDTKYFKDLELEILSQFEDLDKSLDGWLIKSENYQALNTILPKFKEKVQTIYIDPPFNKETDADYFYSVKYKDSSWATLLENRLRSAKDILNDKGSIFVRCDYNGNWIVRPLMNEIFGSENFRNEISVGRTKTAPYIGTAPEKAGVSFKTLMMVYDNIYLYSKSEKFFNKFSEGIIEEKRESYWKDFKTFFDRDYNRYELLGITLEKGCSWMWRKEVAEEAVKNYQEYLREHNLTGISLENYWEKTGQRLNFIKKERNTLKYWVAPSKRVSHNNWTELEGYGRRWGFPTENSETLLKRVVGGVSNEGDLVMDYFLGSGTTTAVAHKLGRKWLGVEMGEHFYTVVLSRMKRVLAYDKSGISKEVKEYQGGGFFKYYELEQYEETLANCKYEDSNLFNSPSKTPYQEYVFMKDEKMLKALEIDYEKEKAKVDLNKLYSNIDIAETLSNLTGKWIKKISDDEVKFEDGTKINTKDLNYKLIKPLIWW